MLFEERFIFIPVRYPEGDWSPSELAYEDVWIASSDGITIHGWYIPHPEPVATIHWSHGNTGNITHRAEEVRYWQRFLPVSVLLYDYRGYGRSEGHPSEEGLYDDARASYHWLRQNKGIPPEQIVLFGRSLGTSVASYLASCEPHACLILEAGFTSAVAMGELMFPWLPIGRFLRNRFDTLSRISDYTGRLLVIHGTDDSVIPFEMGKQLFEAAVRTELKEFYAVEGADHTNVPLVGGENYFRRIGGFLRKAGLPVPEMTACES